MVGRGAALSGYLTAGKTGKGNPKDDSKTGVINVFAAVWKVPCEIWRSKTAFFFLLTPEVFRFANQNICRCSMEFRGDSFEADTYGILLHMEFFYGNLNTYVNKPSDVVIYTWHKVTEGLAKWKCRRFYWYSAINSIHRNHAICRQVLGSHDLLVLFVQKKLDSNH